MVDVYFKGIDSIDKTDEIIVASKEILKEIAEKEGIEFDKRTGLKVHFGEKGNVTYIKSENYTGIIDFLKDKGVDPFYIETNVLYRGERTRRDDHIKLAKEHGFTQIPVEIADGEHGEDFEMVPVAGKHFKECFIGKKIADLDSMVVLSHFKGHMLAGFGGSIKQLAMGCASRGGKLAQHADSKPFINPLKCKKCDTCIKHCPVDAIKPGFIYRIIKSKCIGCASCIAVCPYNATSMNLFGAISSITKKFLERLAEYAFAASKEKEIVYFNFVFNITKSCDCEGKKMKPFTGDLGILASTDPVAVDRASIDLLEEREGKKLFKGKHTLDYAEKIGLGRNE